MGDFVKGPVPDHLPADLVRHLHLHRQIDSYTALSPAFQCSRKRLDPGFRYARAVLVDVFYDHLLACDWEDYSQQSLADFAQQVYRGLSSCFELLSPALQQQLPRMIEHDWLTSYREPAVVKRVLQRLETRIDHKFPLAEGFSELNRCRAGLEVDFRLFMIEMKEAVATRKQMLDIDFESIHREGP